jgi:small-conductance mechanosensitive channel
MGLGEMTTFQSVESIILESLSNELILRLIFTFLVLIVALIILKEYHKHLEKMATARTIESSAIEKLYKAAAFITLLFVIIIIAYAFTKSRAAWVAAAIITAVIIFASWDYIVNGIAYFFLLSTHYITQGDYIIVGNSVEGRVREITSLYTILEDRGKVKHIPNRDLITKGFIIVGEPSYLRIIVKVSGLSGPEDVDEIRHTIENSLSMKTSDLFSFHQGLQMSPMIRVYPKEIGSDSAIFVVEVPIPSPSPHLIARRASSLIYPIASVLRDSGYNFNIEIEGV